MKRLIQHDVVFVRHFQTIKWPFELHSHNHFELVFIHAGSGIHYLNGEKFDYSAHSLFVLAPSDQHIFDIKEETTFTVLKFTNIFLGQDTTAAQKAEWDRITEQLIIASGDHTIFSADKGTLEKIDVLMLLIAREWAEHPVPSNKTILHIARAVFSLLLRMTEGHLAELPAVRSEQLTGVLHYIHLNISNPDQLQLETMAARLQLSKARLSALFKQELNFSVKDYINDYKYRQVENKLTYSSLTIKEISVQFGFADLSHLNKFFKKIKGMSPRAYRVLLEKKSKNV